MFTPMLVLQHLAVFHLEVHNGHWTEKERLVDVHIIIVIHSATKN